MFSKPVGGCPWYFNVTPLNIIIPGVTSLLCEVGWLRMSRYHFRLSPPHTRPCIGPQSDDARQDPA